MSKPKLYLAHPGPDRHWVRELELQMEKELNIELINPFYDRTERNDIKKIDAGKMSLYSGRLDAKGIVEGDLAAVREAEGVLAFLTESLLLGTAMEIFFNAYVLHKPTYLIISRKEWTHHPWLEYLATKRFNSVDEFKAYWRRKHK